MEVTPLTRIQTLVINLCKKLNLRHLESEVEIYTKDSQYHCMPQSTLKQNQVEPNSLLIAKMGRTNAGWNYFNPVHDFQTVNEYKKYQKKNYLMSGLNIEACCVAERCVEYGITKYIPLGTGTFHFQEVLNSIVCNHCPGRDMGTNPPMAVKKIRFVKCFWRYDGEHPDRNGFLGYHYIKSWFKVEESDELRLSKVLRSQNWKDFTIYVRGL